MTLKNLTFKKKKELKALSSCKRGCGKWQRSPAHVVALPSDVLGRVNRLCLPPQRSKGVRLLSLRGPCKNTASGRLIQLSVFVQVVMRPEPKQTLKVVARAQQQREEREPD